MGSAHQRLAIQALVLALRQRAETVRHPDVTFTVRDKIDDRGHGTVALAFRYDGSRLDRKAAWSLFGPPQPVAQRKRRRDPHGLQVDPVRLGLRGAGGLSARRAPARLKPGRRCQNLPGPGNSERHGVV